MESLGVDKKKDIHIVRLATEAYFRGDSYCFVKTLKLLKRKSKSVYNVFNECIREELSNFGEPVFIEGMDELPDGIYELVHIYDYFDEVSEYRLVELK